MNTYQNRRSPDRRRRTVPVALTTGFVALALTLSACGSGDDAAANEASQEQESASANAESNSMEAFQQCMAQNGADFGGEPPTGPQDGAPPSIDQDAMQQARESCADLMPEGGPGQRGGPGGGFDPEAIQAWSTCMADNGVEVQTPVEGDRPSGEPPSEGTAPEQPAEDPMPQQPPEGEAPGAASMFGMDTSDPAVAAALEACADLQPEMGAGPAGAPGAQMPAKG